MQSAYPAALADWAKETFDKKGKAMYSRRINKMIDFHSKEIKSKVLSWFIELIYKFDLSIQLFIHEILFTQPLHSGRIWHKVNF